MQNLFLFVSSVVCLLGTVGCGPNSDNAPVRGVVVFEDDSPVNSGNVSFDDGSYSDRAFLNADGSFQVEAGLPPGAYKVTLSSAWGDTPTSRPLVHSRYGTYDTTDLSAEILDQPNELRLTVDRPKK